MNRAQRRGRGLVLPTGDAVPSACSVGVGFCHPAEVVTPQFRRSLAFLYQYDARSRALPWIVSEYDHEASGVHVPDARCAIVRRFLADPAQPQWLLMVDTDATFGPDILDRLMDAADPRERPIIGALAFGVGPKTDEFGVEQFNAELACELELFPTIYFFDDDGRSQRLADYPLDTLIRVHSTGAHCFLAHRDVFADARWTEDGHPLPWFRTAVRADGVVSEDQFFMVRAGGMGYPVHVHTGIKTGHVKTFVADETMYLKQRALDAMFAAAAEVTDVVA